MKKVLVGSLVLNVVLIIGAIVVYNTRYTFVSCDTRGECYEVQQKIGDYLLGRD